MFNRRNFLKNFGIGGAVLSAPSVVANDQSANTEFVTIKGTVSANGKGIPQVSVTDGYTVVRTDNNGKYQIKAHSQAEFVYISVPSGYEFPNEKGVARFYQKIDTTKSTFQANFTLKPLSVDDTKHQFVVWADPQIISKKDAEELQKSGEDLAELVKAAPKDTLFHGIGCGDLVWDHFELLDDYISAFGKAQIPFFSVIGNHDMDLDARTDDFSSKTFKNTFGPTYYSFNRGKVHYVVLDDVFFMGTAKKYVGYLTENQLHWLEQDLASVPKGSTVVVSLHIPTNTGHARRNKLKEEELGGTVANRRQLYKMLEPFQAHIMSGHTHVNEKWEEGNIIEHVHGTVCGAWWTGPICTDGSPSGYGVYQVDGGNISWYYKGTGKPATYQLKVYPKGANKDFPESIIANVWNWDKKWKIEWWEDGIAKGAMEQKVGLDPFAIELFAGPDLPKKHKFVDPTLTDHLFFAQPSAQAKTIVVKATDRFGNEYSEQINL